MQKMNEICINFSRWTKGKDDERNRKPDERLSVAWVGRKLGKRVKTFALLAELRWLVTEAPLAIREEAGLNLALNGGKSPMVEAWDVWHISRPECPDLPVVSAIDVKTDISQSLQMAGQKRSLGR